MGNYISCTLSCHTKSPKVIVPEGEILRCDAPTNAAELMFDMPGHYVVNSCSLRIGWRLTALAADECLEKGNVYVMFPGERIGSKVTAADVGRHFMAVRQRGRGTARVLPESSPTAAEEGGGLKLEEMSEVLVGDVRHRLSVGRSRRPLLETIEE